MKKWLTVVLTLIFIISASAFAEGVEITQQAFYVRPFLSYFAGEVFCEMKNTTDKPMKITGGLYEVYGPDGTTVDSGKIYSFYPDILQPGEIGYFSVEAPVKEAASADAIADYSVSISSEPSALPAVRYAVSDLAFEVSGSIYTSIKFSGTVTNDTGATAGDIHMEFAAYAADGTFIGCESAASMGLHLHDGSAADMSASMSSDLTAAILNAGLEIASVQAIACNLW